MCVCAISRVRVFCVLMLVCSVYVCVCVRLAVCSCVYVSVVFVIATSNATVTDETAATIGQRIELYCTLNVNELNSCH